MCKQLNGLVLKSLKPKQFEPKKNIIKSGPWLKFHLYFGPGRVELGCGNKDNCPHVRPRPTGEMPSAGGLSKGS